MKLKTIAKPSMFSAGLWLAYGALRTAFGLGPTHALMLVVIGVFAWFVLYLLWVLPPPEETAWRKYGRLGVAICATLGLGVLSLRASNLVNWVALGGFLVVLLVGSFWAGRPIRHTG